MSGPDRRAEVVQHPRDALTGDEMLADEGQAPDGRGLSQSADLGRRLSQLSPGHPSSPYQADGSPKPPVPRLRDLEFPDEDPSDQSDPADRADRADPADQSDQIRPLTDQEHAEHAADARARLDKAHADGLATDQQYTLDPNRQSWSRDRRAAHYSIINDLYDSAADVPCGHKAIVAGGLGGSGKSTVLGQYAGIDRSQYLTINPDDIKEEMARRGLVPEVEGVSPMEASDLVHEESSYLARQLALRARADGKNVIWDITMSSRASTERRIDDLRAAGYTQIDAIFVDIPVETSVSRADARHRMGHDKYRAGQGLGGRLVPPEVIRAQADPEWGSLNRRTFEDVKPRCDNWSRYDNSVDGRDPVLAETSGHMEVHSDKLEERV